MLKTINILNKRARFDYEIIEKFTAGIVLVGTEIKSIRLGKANITESLQLNIIQIKVEMKKSLEL